MQWLLNDLAYQRPMSECAFIVYECYVNDGLRSYVPIDDSDALEEYALMQCEDAAHIVWWDDAD